MNMKQKLVGAVLTASLWVSGTAMAVTEIEWWHAMSGRLGEKVNSIAQEFNASQSEYRLVPVFKGNYAETMTAAITAYRARQQPQIVQVFEVGTATMMAAKGAIYPVYQLMKDMGQPFNPNSYISAVAGYYTDNEGNMLSMPFNSSTPVLYYNKDAFRKAGLDPNSPPKTWEELETAARKIQAAGYPCGFTTAWQSWVHLENFSAWHNQSFGTQSNGFGGLDTELAFNGPLQVAHISKMGEWQKTRLFDYSGRTNEGQTKFYNEECAMYTESSAGYAGIRGNVKTFEFGVGNLPYWAAGVSEPQNTIIGGATLWVLNGHSKEQYRGVASFFAFLSSPEVQADWHQFTGYLPITKAAYGLTLAEGFYDKNPGTDIAIKQMTGNEPTDNSKGLRFGNFVQIRGIIDEELESVWAGKKSAQEALDNAVARGNDQLRRFERANQ